MSTGKPIPHRREKPCPVCGGWATLPHGRGIRCVGMTGDFLVWCTREERAGNAPLDLSTSPPAYRHHRTGWCPCGTEHDHAMPSPGFAPLSRLVAVATPPATELRTAAADHATVFEGALDLLTLRADARADLTRRGLAAGAIERMRFRSAPETLAARHRFLAAMVERFGEATIRATPGFTDRNHELVFWSGAKYIVPFRDEQGRITGWQAKILGGKYRTARLSSFAHIYHVAGPLTPGADLHVTEGGLKACVAAEIGGVATFGVAGQSLTPNHLAVIQRLAPGRVIVALDQEANAQTVRARQRWAKLLAEAGLPTFIAVWEGADLGGPKGLDDLFVNGSKPRLRQFVFTPPAISTRRIPRPTTTRGDVAAGMSLAAARERVVRAVGQFLRGPHQTDCAQEALLVRAGAGTGKSTAVGLQLDPTSPTRIAVGTTNLAAELALAHGYGLVVGRNEQNCIRADVVGALAANGFDVARLACGSVYEPHCPERRHCPYWLQFERPGPLIGAAEQLYNPTFLRDASVVIADDADLPRAIVERHTVSREAIARAIDRLDDGGPAGAARRLLTLGAHALVGAPLWPALQGPAVWDHLARTAAREGMILAALIEAVPSRWGFPDPERNARGMVSVDTVEAAPPAIVGRLVEALQEELPAFLTGEDFNCRLRLSSSGFSIAALRQPACDDHGVGYLAQRPLLVLDATPVETLVDRLTADHARLPDVGAPVALPEGVHVIQAAARPNGHTGLRDEAQVDAVLAGVRAMCQRYPVADPSLEAVIAFGALADRLIALGMAPDRVLGFGSVRGSNALAKVTQLQVVGRPMPPPAEIAFLAQVVHHDAGVVSAQLTVAPRSYGGQPYEVDVVDFVDTRAAELLHALREDELHQVLQRARLAGVGDAADGRTQVRLILHTSHPVPGLRVDELLLTSPRSERNTERAEDAEARIATAIAELHVQGLAVTDAEVARRAHASRETVAKWFRNAVHTLQKELLEGVDSIPKMLAASEADHEPVAVKAPHPPSSSPPPATSPRAASGPDLVAEPNAAPAPVTEPTPSERVPCRGCGHVMVYPDQQCGSCADEAVQRMLEERKRRRFPYLARHRAISGDGP